MAINENDVIKVDVHMQYGGVDRLLHVWHYQLQGDDNVDDGLVTSAITSDIVLHYLDLKTAQSDQLSYLFAGYYNLTQDRPMEDESITAIGSGSEVGTTLPLQASGLVIFRTATKRSVGKKFIPAIISGRTINGQKFDATTLSVITLWATGMFTPPVVGAGIMQPGNYNAPLASFRPYISYLTRPGVYTQRRRRVGVGQ